MLSIYLTSVVASEDQKQQKIQDVKKGKAAQSAESQELTKAIRQAAGSRVGSHCDNLPTDIARLIAEYTLPFYETGEVMKTVTGIELPKMRIGSEGPFAWKWKNAKGEDTYLLFSDIKDGVNQKEAAEYCDGFNKKYPELGCKFGLLDGYGFFSSSTNTLSLGKLGRDMGFQGYDKNWNPPKESHLSEAPNSDQGGRGGHRSFWSSSFCEDKKCAFLLDGSKGYVTLGFAPASEGSALCACTVSSVR
ncbi:MAG: hypothetical protein HQK51_02030 [Oligoflexia bacterium]|nr:hypothetical protein [Oligoflexia bacterium]